MTTTTHEAPVLPARDGRGSPLPTPALVAARFLELRKRRGLMLTLVGVTIGIPTLFFAVRLVLHAVAPKTYGPAGGYDIYTGLTAGVLYTFGFIVAAALGATAGSADLTDGVFRHLVVTGRSRVALYLARIPAGLAIIGPLVAIGFTVVCFMCTFAAPKTLTFNGVKVPAGMSRTGLEQWAESHVSQVICRFPTNEIPVNAPCGGDKVPPGLRPPVDVGGPSDAELRSAAMRIADASYPEYSHRFLSPPVSLMVKTGLWLELEAAIGFVVGLGLGSLLGQRTVAVVMMIALELVITPIVLRVRMPHLENVQRSVIGVATAHLEPSQLPLAFGGGDRDFRITESTTTAAIVIVAWLVVWTVIGAWRMATRDA